MLTRLSTKFLEKESNFLLSILSKPFCLKSFSSAKAKKATKAKIKLIPILKKKIKIEEDNYEPEKGLRVRKIDIR